MAVTPFWQTGQGHLHAAACTLQCTHMCQRYQSDCPCLKGAAVPLTSHQWLPVLMRPMLVRPLQNQSARLSKGSRAVLASQVTHDAPVHVAIQLCQQGTHIPEQWHAILTSICMR